MLEQFRCELREFRSLSLGQGNVPRQRVVFELLDRVTEPVAAEIEVRVIDLVRIAGQDDLRSLAGARDDGFDLVRGEILRFVYNDELLRDAAAPDVGERLRLEE